MISRGHANCCFPAKWGHTLLYHPSKPCGLLPLILPFGLSEFQGHHTELHPVPGFGPRLSGRQGTAAQTDRPHAIITPAASTAFGEPLSRPPASVRNLYGTRDPWLPEPVTTLTSSLPNPVTALTSSLPNPVTTRIKPVRKVTLATGRVAVRRVKGCRNPFSPRGRRCRRSRRMRGRAGGNGLIEKDFQTQAARKDPLNRPAARPTFSLEGRRNPV